MTHKMITNRDMHRFNIYNKILELCREKAINATALSRMIAGSNAVSIMNYCRSLAQEGYLKTSIKKAGTYNTPAIFYKARKGRRYKIEDLVPISVKIQKTMQANGSSVKGGGLSKDSKAEKASKSKRHLGIYRMEDVPDLYLAQAKQIKAEHKSVKNYVSGGTLSAAV